MVEDINATPIAAISVAAILDDEWANRDRFRGCEVELVKGIGENLGLGDTFVVCIGYPEARKTLVNLVQRSGLRPHKALVHPWTNIARNCRVGDGSAILGGTSVSPNVVIGRNSFVGAEVVIGHDTVIGDNVSIMPGACISGEVSIGSNVLVGAGATILDKVVIENGATVGAASLVTRDVKSGATVLGVPARER